MEVEEREDAFARLVGVCMQARDVTRARRVHAAIARSAPPIAHSIFLTNRLITLYARCGSLRDARATFDAATTRNAHSWNALLTAYAAAGLAEGAARIFSAMPCICAVATTAMLDAYARLGRLRAARAVYSSLPPFLRDLPCRNAMLFAFARNGHFSAAARFLRHHIGDDANRVTAATPLIALARAGRLEDAQLLFDAMAHDSHLSLPQNAHYERCTIGTLVADTLDAEKGQMQHDDVRPRNLPQGNAEDGQVPRRPWNIRSVVTWTAMVSAYGEVGYLHNARRFFECMPSRDATSWHVMVAAQLRAGAMASAAATFEAMPARSSLSWSLLLSSLLRVDVDGAYLGRAADVLRRMPRAEDAAADALARRYIRAGSPAVAKQLFDLLPERPQQAWDAMLLQEQQQQQRRQSTRSVKIVSR